MTVIFVLLLAVTVLYLILKQDVLCGIGIILTLVLGILVIYGILSAPEESGGERAQTVEHRGVRHKGDAPRVDPEDMLQSNKRKKRNEHDEDAEADEDLFIAYEAMNDWEDLEDL